MKGLAIVTIATMTFEEYKDIEHPAPYIVYLEGRSGVGLLYCGARHSCDPADPMFGDIQARFLACQPQVALIEDADPTCLHRRHPCYQIPTTLSVRLAKVDMSAFSPMPTACPS